MGLIFWNCSVAVVFLPFFVSHDVVRFWNAVDVTYTLDTAAPCRFDVANECEKLVLALLLQILTCKFGSAFSVMLLSNFLALWVSRETV